MMTDRVVDTNVSLNYVIYILLSFHTAQQP